MLAQIVSRAERRVFFRMKQHITKTVEHRTHEKHKENIKRNKIKQRELILAEQFM